MWKQNGLHFADEILLYISMKGKFYFIEISLKFAPKALIDSKLALV